MEIIQICPWGMNECAVYLNHVSSLLSVQYIYPVKITKFLIETPQTLHISHSSLTPSTYFLQPETQPHPFKIIKDKTKGIIIVLYPSYINKKNLRLS